MIYRTLLIAGIMVGLTPLAASAHTVQVAEDVGATLHIEPHDIAQAGQPTEVWFALTRAGGTVIPLAHCDCRLTLYDHQATVLATPPLLPLSTKGFNAIPGATVTFPEVGAYTLVLQGVPQGAGQFTPFDLSFDITVAGQAPTAATADILPAPSTDPNPNPSATNAAANSDANTAAQPQPETSAVHSTSNPWTAVAVWGGAVLLVGLMAAIIGRRQSPGEKRQ